MEYGGVMQNMVWCEMWSTDVQCGSVMLTRYVMV